MRLIRAFLPLIFILPIILWLFDFYGTPKPSIDEKLEYLKQPKDIARLDFLTLGAEIIGDRNSVEIIESNKALGVDFSDSGALRLKAVLDSRILLNGKWLRINETFNHNDEKYRLIAIGRNSIVLQNMDDLSTITILMYYVDSKVDINHSKDLKASGNTSLDFNDLDNAKDGFILEIVN